MILVPVGHQVRLGVSAPPASENAAGASPRFIGEVLSIGSLVKRVKRGDTVVLNHRAVEVLTIDQAAHFFCTEDAIIAILK